MIKSTFDVDFFPNAVICGNMLHNMIFNRNDIYINELIQSLKLKDLVKAICGVPTIKHGDHDHINEQMTQPILERGKYHGSINMFQYLIIFR